LENSGAIIAMAPSANSARPLVRAEITVEVD
jgi:hypothetical protein